MSRRTGRSAEGAYPPPQHFAAVATGRRLVSSYSVWPLVRRRVAERF
jgi:hypothetical protein